jgi:hypothetical protein
MDNKVISTKIKINIGLKIFNPDIFGGVHVAHSFSFLCYLIMCIYVLSFVLWCSLRFMHKNYERKWQHKAHKTKKKTKTKKQHNMCWTPIYAANTNNVNKLSCKQLAEKSPFLNVLRRSLTVIFSSSYCEYSTKWINVT